MLADPIQTLIDGRMSWLFPDGRTLPVVSGAAEGDPPASDTPPADPPADPPPTDPPASDLSPTEPPGDPDDGSLGEGGKKALAAEREARRKAEAELKRLKKIEDELTELKALNLTDHEKAIADARREADEVARAEVSEAANKRLFRAEVKAEAKDKLADPSLLADVDVALKLLDLDEIPLTGTGDIDAEAISAAVASLVEDKPYLAASATRPPPTTQGPRKTTDPVDPAKLTDPKAIREWAAGNRRKRS